MAIKKINIEEFVQLAETNLVVDARSPGEFVHAHYPGAYNLALFTDEERKVVGTAYKQQGRRQAIRIGLDYFGIKMRSMVEEIESLVKKQPSASILIHCWRGGMRSEAIAWLLDLYGFKVLMLIGGYKRFRQYVLETFAQPLHLTILSGYTGSGKTGLLHQLENNGQKTVDLENIAHHKGSAFGAIDQMAQPSQEMFENILALKLRSVLGENIWVEDESQRIGTVIIPNKLWEQMLQSPGYFLDIPFEERLNKIYSEYGNLDRQKLIDATLRIRKRLGGLEAKTAVQHIQQDEIKEAFRILLRYYDKCYKKSTVESGKIGPTWKVIVSESVNELTNIGLLMGTLNTKSNNV